MAITQNAGKEGSVIVEYLLKSLSGNVRKAWMPSENPRVHPRKGDSKLGYNAACPDHLMHISMPLTRCELSCWQLSSQPDLDRVFWH